MYFVQLGPSINSTKKPTMRIESLVKTANGSFILKLYANISVDNIKSVLTKPMNANWLNFLTYFLSKFLQHSKGFDFVSAVAESSSFVFGQFVAFAAVVAAEMH